MMDRELIQSLTVINVPKCSKKKFLKKSLIPDITAIWPKLKPMNPGRPI